MDLFTRISINFTFIIWISCIFHHCYGQSMGTFSDITNLKTLLLTSYDKDIRATQDFSYPTRVKVSFELINLFDLDEVSGIFSIYAVLGIYWEDHRMAWVTSTYGGAADILLHKDVVWTPKLTVANPGIKLKLFGHEDGYVRFQSTSDAYWMVGDIIHSSCDVDANYFPFDKQICYIYFFTWGYQANEIVLVSANDEVDMNYFVPNGVWSITSTYADTVTIGDINFLRFSFKLERRSTYFIINAFMPIFVLGLLNTMVFVLPAESGERVGYTITCLLAIAVLLTIISDNLPKTSNPIPMISYFLMADLCISTLISVITIVNLRLHMKDEKSKVPGFLQGIVGIIKCKKCKKPRMPNLCCRQGNDTVENIIIVQEFDKTDKKQMVKKEDSKNQRVFHHDEEIQKSSPNSVAEKKKQNMPLPEPEMNEADDQEITWQDIAGIIDFLTFFLGNFLTVVLVMCYLTVATSLAK